MGKEREFLAQEAKKMKRLIIILLIVLFIFAGSVSLKGQDSKANERIHIQKTYFLKNVSGKFVLNSLKVYILDHSYNGNILSVTIRRDNVEIFEKLLKKIDVKRKKINFRIFAVIGSHNGQKEKIENKDLRNVLNELKEVLTINSFKLDGVGSLAVVDGVRRSAIRLSSKSGLNLKLSLHEISIKSDSKGKRSVHFQFEVLHFMESTSFIKENGYLVAGVSKIGKNGDSLILIINADIE